jgi:hypothetical protein
MMIDGGRNPKAVVIVVDANIAATAIQSDLF